MTALAEALAAALGEPAAPVARDVPATYDVPADRWLDALVAVRDAGGTYLDFLTAVDDGDTLAVVVHLARADAAEHLLLRTRVDAAEPRLESAVPVLPGAEWHERETAEMFGVEFVGHPDPRPLLTRPSLHAHPLRRSFVLAARVVRPWPGSKDPQDAAAAPGARRGNPSRRRQPPPGVPEGWVRDE